MNLSYPPLLQPLDSRYEAVQVVSAIAQQQAVLVILLIGAFKLIAKADIKASCTLEYQRGGVVA
jgi:hypothetical protein